MKLSRTTGRTSSATGEISAGLYYQHCKIFKFITHPRPSLPSPIPRMAPFPHLVSPTTDWEPLLHCTQDSPYRSNRSPAPSRSLSLSPGLFSGQQVRGVGGLPARHDRQRVGLAAQRQGGLQQGQLARQGRLVRRERQLLRHRRQPARQVLVPGALQVLKGQQGPALLAPGTGRARARVRLCLCVACAYPGAGTGFYETACAVMAFELSCVRTAPHAGRS